MENLIMKSIRLPIAALAALLAFQPGRAELVLNPHEVAASVDFGQIVKGYVKDGVYENQPISRTGVYLTATGTHNERFEVRMTVGGLLWLPLMPPSDASAGARIVQFGPGVGQAQGIYTFGDLQKPSAKLQVGLFPIKYNPDASNLGEYLYRSGTYPGYIWNGGWSYLNSAAYLAQGVRYSLYTFNGMLNHDFTLFMERDIEPIHDLSPGYALTARPLPFLELGAGVVWAHAIALKKETGETGVTPHVAANAYSKTTNRPYNYAGDSSPCKDSLAANASSSDCGYYTFRGFKTMARASFDVGALLGVEQIRAGEFKVYSEVALLGVQDQPFYYENKSERMPVMFGVKLPTFGFLDALSYEMEYHKSRYANTITMPINDNLPLPITSFSDNPINYADGAPENTNDDWKWSVNAKRRLTEGVNLYAQVASDNARHFGVVLATPYDLPATQSPSQWYYVLRLEFGLF
jgi:hypothetical protein